jgi:hypothetical protein
VASQLSQAAVLVGGLVIALMIRLLWNNDFQPMKKKEVMHTRIAGFSSIDFFRQRNNFRCAINAPSPLRICYSVPALLWSFFYNLL